MSEVLPNICLDSVWYIWLALSKDPAPLAVANNSCYLLSFISKCDGTIQYFILDNIIEKIFL